MSTELRQRLDVEEEESEKLIATVEDMQKGVGLDFEALIQLPTFEEIRLHLLHSGSEQPSRDSASPASFRLRATLEKLIARNPDLDLSYLDDVDEPMVDVDPTVKVVDGEMGVEKVVAQDVELEKVVE